jgi:hypothetical protein
LTELTELPMARATHTGVNLRDSIPRKNLENGIPAQFVYEPADCRIYYEPSMIVDVSKLWEAAADVAWGSKKCVQGHLNLQKRTLEPGAGKRYANFQRTNLPVFPPLEPYRWRDSIYGRPVWKD